MTGASGLGGPSGALFAQAAHATSKVSALKPRSEDDGGTDATGSADAGQITASISGLGQLFSNLQQLQTQDPARFTQLVSQIAGTLQSAAQQQTGESNKLLERLADVLKQSAATGTAPESNRAGGSEVQSYSRTGQPVTATAVSGLGAEPASGLPELFKSLASQVGAMLGA